MTRNANIELGDRVRHHIHGMEGAVVARSWPRNNCERVAVQPSALKDGKVAEAHWFDILDVEVVEPGAFSVVAPARPAVRVENGDVVRDRLTGLVGTVVARTEWSNGCSRIMVQPRELKDGAPIDPSSIDELDAVLLERANPPVEQRQTGGPRHTPELRR